jgi:DNA-binding transcriptional regulator YdaS (Cro superfamily)
MDTLLKYLNALPKAAQIAFGVACGTTLGYMRKAASAGQLLKPEVCVLIETKSKGAVTRVDLRPDDWAGIWPELARSPRRATDPAQPGHAGRQPPTPCYILDTVPDGAVVSAIPVTKD